MQLLPPPTTSRGPADRFTGDVWVDMIPNDDPPSRLRAGVVRFAPGPTPPGIATSTARPSTSSTATDWSRPAAVR